MDSRQPSNDSGQAQLQTAMKAVGQAIELDSDGNAQGAYLQYLSCMQYISQCLLQDARNKAAQPGPVSLKTKTALRMAKLAHQCSERVSAIMANMEEGSTSTTSLIVPTAHFSSNLSPSPPPPFQPPPSQPPPSHTQSTKPRGSSPHMMLSLSASTGRISPSMFPSVPSTLSQSVPTHVAVVRPTVQHPGQQSGTAPSFQPAVQRDDTLSPLEKAYRENRRLMAAYRSRLSRMQTGKNKAIVNLTFQRRLMENMAIARAREASLAKKIKERQQRLHEQAAQRFSSSGQPTKEEMELRVVYANIMEYESIKTWLQDWRQRLQESPRDLKLIHDLVTEILSSDGHPLTQLLKRYQIIIYHKIMPLIQKDLMSIEEIVVPYKDIVPLKLQEPRAIPEDGFTTPDELDQSMDEMLSKRLHALRENSTSSMESEASDSRPSSQADSLLFSPADMSTDALDELLAVEEEESSVSVGKGDEQNDGILGKSGETEPPGERTTEQNGKHERNGDLESNTPDKGLQNGVSTADSDDVSRERTAGDDDVALGNDSDDAADEEDDSNSVVDTMRKIVSEVREDIVKAVEDGDKLCQDLEEGKVSLGASDDSGNVINDQSTSTVKVTKKTDTSGDECVDSETKDRTKKREINDSSIDRNGSDGRLSDKSLNSESIDDSCRPGKHEGLRQDEKEDCETAPNQESVTTNGDHKDSVSNDKDADAGEVEGDGNVEESEPKGEGGEERIAEMKAEAVKRHLENISKDVLMFTERLLSILVAVYEQLNSTTAKEQCIAVIEVFFFRDIWQPLLMLFRRFNYSKEKSAAIAMTKYQHAMPQHIGVHEKFCLLPEGTVQDGSQASPGYPYQPAVEELCKLQGYTCPLEKLECIVRVSKVIIECVGDFFESQGKPRQSPETSVGCDDLLPILSYVIIKSAMPQFVSECNAMEEFIHEGYLFGEEGYCLTTCQTALSYVLKLGSTEDQPS
ncbi:VPS9 domain-containing protein 1-like [Diadema antillarum]|uniref:VPS9 domain-containing protein 1-like n=1 Tax=Diadema antillarum TaxID=105358 RepID=UPI003A8A2A6B